MDLYADKLGAGLLDTCENNLSVRQFTPSIPAWCKVIPDRYNLKMRLARYLAYPMQSVASQGQINHIVDHGYAHLIPFLDRKRTIVTVHDLIPILTWHGKIPGLTSNHRPRLVEFSLGQLKKAAHIIVVSHNTKKDLIKYCQCDEQKITVVHNGLNEGFKPYDLNQRMVARKSFGFDEDHKIILLSGLGAYKNHKTSLKVVEELIRKFRGLVKVVRFGQFSDEWEKLIVQFGLQNFALGTGPLSQNRIIDLYNSVDCLLFPSWYEGFGWPPLEAMACGTPVVTSNVASLPEVVGDAGLMEAPGDVEALTKAVLAILTNEELRKSLIQKGLERSQEFSWQKSIKNVLKVYRMAVEPEFLK